jgi:hypothetical protein
MNNNESTVAGTSESAQGSTLVYMRAAKRWIVYAPDKQPFYLDGTPRRGMLDAAEDAARLGTYADACNVVTGSNGHFAGIGFALGPDGSGRYWQGVDFDDVAQNQLSDLANVRFGYVELSPGGNGCHVIGYGTHFPALGPNGTGIEAYAHGRYFTVTERLIFDGSLVDLAPWVTSTLAPRHQTHAQARAADSSAGAVYVDPQTVTALRSALAHLRADDYREWIAVGQALKELGPTGRGLWWDWSQTSDKCKPTDAKKWDSFDGDRTGYAAVFAKAQAAGWVNPASKAAQPEPVPQGGFTFKYSHTGGTVLAIEYLNDPWLPRATVIGCYGRGEAGKSSWVAQICASVSHLVSTLWITSEERQDHILQRHESCHGHPGTLAVIEAMPTKLDPKTKKPIATSFNIFEHMEPAIVAFQQDHMRRQDRPLGVVVLDAVVALVTWEKGTNANDDGGVKKLIAHLFTLSERYGVTFVMLGHLNKGANKDHMADAVTGAAAWTNSVRLAYMFVKNLESENYEGFIRTVKSNTGVPFGATYRTVPVYTLRQRPDGHHDVLCGVVMVGGTVYGEIALREMMATEDDDRYLSQREEKRQKVQAIVDQTLREVAGGQTTTRKAVEVKLGDKMPRRYWTAAEAKLNEHGVQWENCKHNERLYRLAGPN